MITKADALQSLTPGAEWVLRGDELEWLSTDIPEPTDIEIETERARLEYLEGVYEYRRKREYPPISEQLDKIYHEGLDAWKAEIDAVKAENPKAYPNEADQAAHIKAHVDQYVFDKQLAAYTEAIARLEQYPLAEGRGPITEMQETGEYDEQTGEPITQEVVISPAIDPLEPVEVEETVFVTDSDGEQVLDSDGMPVTETVMVRNPILVQDEGERAEAEDVIAETPEAVIDRYNADGI
jgi:hypothetical protein